MARRPKGNYKAYIRRWHENYGDGYKIFLDGKL